MLHSFDYIYLERGIDNIRDAVLDFKRREMFLYLATNLGNYDITTFELSTIPKCVLLSLDVTETNSFDI